MLQLIVQCISAVYQEEAPVFLNHLHMFEPFDSCPVVTDNWWHSDLHLTAAVLLGPVIISFVDFNGCLYPVRQREDFDLFVHWNLISPQLQLRKEQCSAGWRKKFSQQHPVIYALDQATSPLRLVSDLGLESAQNVTIWFSRQFWHSPF